MARLYRHGLISMLTTFLGLLLFLTIASPVAGAPNMTYYDGKSIAPPKIPHSTTQSSAPDKIPSRTTSTPSEIVKAAIQTQPTQSCMPVTSIRISAIDLASSPEGVSIISDTQSYNVYGQTLAQLKDQIKRCGPSDIGLRFAASTAYSLTSRYDVQQTGSTCRITNIHVGIHTIIVLPLFQTTSSTPNQVSAHWNEFMSSLVSHENGHKALGIGFAHTQYNQLTALPPGECTTIKTQAQNVVTATNNALSTANNDYDSTTAHGTTQGAVLR